MSSSSVSPTSRNAHPSEVEVSDRLHADPRRIAREIRDRHVLHIDDAPLAFEAVAIRPAVAGAAAVVDVQNREAAAGPSRVPG